MELNVLIVDDEPIVCRGLRETVPWDEWGVHVVGEAHDGGEALEALARHDVDLVLSDIRMPGMDGLELSRAVSERYPDKRIVILSGYDEFEYARQAMRLGVKDYLLKPVNLDELMTVIRNIRRELKEERAQKWRSAARRLLSAAAAGERVTAFPPELELVPGLRCRLAAGAVAGDAGIRPAGRERERADGVGPWTGAIEEWLQGDGCLAAVVPAGPNRFVAFCGMAGDGDDKAAFRRMAETFRRQSGFRMWCCLSPPVRDPDGLRDALGRTVKGLGAFPVVGDAVFGTDEIPEPAWLDPDEEALRFRRLVETGSDRGTLRRLADELFGRLLEHRYGLDDAARFLQQLEDRLLAGLPSRRELQAAGGPHAGGFGSFEELRALFLQDLESVAVRDDSGVCTEQRMLVDKALRYMNEHYAKDLRASKVAGWINVSPNYFSQLLKKVTGKHFNDLLHEIRIERAKRLLAETDYRIFQVGRLVGYKEYKYFVYSFKRLTSVSPSRYRMMAYQAKRKNRADSEGSAARHLEAREARME